METGLDTNIIFAWGPFKLHEVVVTTWGIMLVLVVASYLITRNLREQPSRWQTALEGIVLTMEDAIAAVDPNNKRRILPLIGTLWIFLVVANLLGVIPGLHSPTRDLSVTTALALVVFCSVYIFGVQQSGWSYFLHYVRPSPLLLPFHVISELTRTLALAVRLFGNMMSLEMAALLILIVAGFLAPIPILMLHIIEALVQAYIFGMLALIYVSSAMQQDESISTKTKHTQSNP